MISPVGAVRKVGVSSRDRQDTLFGHVCNVAHSKRENQKLRPANKTAAQQICMRMKSL